MATVLLVDDERGFLVELTRALNKAGYSVVCCESGLEAIAVGCHFRPDVLLLDFVLKDEINGLEVAQAIHLAAPETRAIMLSGILSQELEDEAYQKGLSRFIPKPFMLSDLLESINRSLEAPTESQEGPPVGVVVTTAEGELKFQNDQAHALFADLGIADDRNRIMSFLSEYLGDDENRWVTFTPRHNSQRRWLGCKRTSADGAATCYALLDYRDRGYRSLMPLQQLLDAFGAHPVSFGSVIEAKAKASNSS
jgi:two-component system, cell cycle response regulator CpdR